MADTATPETIIAPPPPPAASPPSDAFIVLPVRQMVMFPEIVAPLAIGRPASIAAAQQAVREQRQIVVLLQRDPSEADPSPDQMHAVGVVANILRYVTGEGEHHVICQGVQRFRITETIPGWPYMVARGLHLPEPTDAGPEVEARLINLRGQALEVLSLVPQAPQELRRTVESLASAGALADLAAAYMDTTAAEKQDVLETIPLIPRLDKVGAHLAHRLQVLRLSRDIGAQTEASLSKRQREMLLRADGLDPEGTGRR